MVSASFRTRPEKISLCRSGAMSAYSEADSFCLRSATVAEVAMETENLASLEALMLKVTVGTSATSSDGAGGLDSVMMVTGGEEMGGGAPDVKQGRKAVEGVVQHEEERQDGFADGPVDGGTTTGGEDGSKVGWLVDGTELLLFHVNVDYHMRRLIVSLGNPARRMFTGVPFNTNSTTRLV
jgi:hypothetical protein